jgi:hypothetical protein
MSHLKEIETENRLTAGRNRSHRTFRTAGQVDRINASGIQVEEIGVKQSTFAEDFMLEHSNSSLFIAMIGSAGRYAGATKEPQKSTQHYGFPS